MTHTAAHWGIVGGGILGLTLAYRLAQQGQRVTVFEAAAQVGGLASAWTLGDIVWDRHYHVTLLSDLAWRGVLTELGLGQEMVWRETRTGFYTNGRLYSMSNTLEFLRFPPLSLWQKCRLAATILYAARTRNWRRLEQIPVTDWLKTWSGRQTFEQIWRPLLRAKLGSNYPKASAAFIWAIIARMYAARRTGLKKEMFGYMPGGYARILARFAEALEARGVRLQRGYVTTRVAADAGAVHLTFAGGQHAICDHVVLTVPAPTAARLCPSLTEEEHTRLGRIQYQGILCASLLLKAPLADFYVTNITDAWVPFTAVIEMSALVDRQEFGGHTLVYLPKYVPADDPAFTTPDADLKAQFLAALARLYPHFRTDDLLHFGLSRVRHVLAIPTLDYSAHLPPMTTSIPGVYLVNSAHIVHGTLNVNETVQLAEQAARWLISRWRRSPALAGSAS